MITPSCSPPAECGRDPRDSADPLLCVEEVVVAALEEHAKVCAAGFELKLADGHPFRQVVRIHALFAGEVRAEEPKQVQFSFCIEEDVQKQIVVTAILVCPERPNSSIFVDGTRHADVTSTREDTLVHRLPGDPAREILGVQFDFFWIELGFYRTYIGFGSFVKALRKTFFKAFIKAHLVVRVFVVTFVQVSFTDREFSLGRRPKQIVTFLAAARAGVDAQLGCE